MFIAFSLTTLKLSGNGIPKGSNGALEDLELLKELCLDNNCIETVADIIRLERWSQLKLLYLPKNPIQTLNVDDFVRMQQLEYLNVSHSHLKHIELGAFSSLIALKVLDLSNNQLKTIDFIGFLPTMRVLTTFHLNGNELTELDDQFDHIFPALNELLITNNRLNCTYLRRFLNTLRICNGVVDGNVNVDANFMRNSENIRGISCEHVVAEEKSLKSIEVKKMFVGWGLESSYTVLIFIMAFCISLTNLVICVAVLFARRRFIRRKPNITYLQSD